MGKGAWRSPKSSRSKGSSTVGRLGIPPPPPRENDDSSVGSSEFDISLDDSSSIHCSDYSRSTFGDESQRVREDELLLSRLQNELLESIPRQGQVDRTQKTCSNTQASSSGSSSGSPWVDDTDSSSCTSSKTPLSSQCRSATEARRFDEARSRMVAQQQRRRARPPLPVTRPPRDESPSSVRTGKDPSKPIDVTGSPDTPIVPSILDQVRQARLAKATQAKLNNPRREIVSFSAVLPTARIVGLVPQRIELTNIEPIERHQSRVAVKHTVPHVVVPALRSRDDDGVSTMGGTFPDFQTMHYHQRHHRNHRGDIEHGISKANAARKRSVDADDSRCSGGWLCRRTDLELCLICTVVSALVTLGVLLALMVLGSK